MAVNPLQKYFRQPKIYVRLPSRGLFSSLGSIENASDELPVMSMTGMDELILKTPDALLNGSATVKVIESCCPNIKNGWEISSLDLDMMLIAIRIATYGPNMDVGHVCANCGSDNDYDVNLMNLIEHFNTCKYDPKVVLKDLTVYIKPLSYKVMTQFNSKNFELQSQLRQALEIEDEEVKDRLISELYEKLASLQNESYLESVERVEAPEGTVDERAYILEWLQNSEKSIFTAIKEQIDLNNKTWRIPNMPVKCENCGHDSELEIEMDQASFFAVS